MTRDAIRPIEDGLAREVVDRSGLVRALGVERWSWAEGVLRAATAKAAEEAGIAAAQPLVASLSHAGAPLTAADGGGGLGLGLAFGLVLVASEGTFGNGDIPVDATQETTAAGERTTARTTGRLAVSTAGSRISAQVTFGIDVSVFDATTGALKGKGSFTTTGSIDLDLCPDASGAVRGHVSLRLAGSTGVDGAAEVSTEADIIGTVGEDANLNSIAVEGSTTDSTAAPGGTARGSTVSAGFRVPIRRDHSWDLDAAEEHGQVDAETDRLSDEEVTARYGRIGSVAGVAAGLLASVAQDKWKGGACVEIHSTETGRRVRPNEHVQFAGTVFHKIEQREIDKPIIATFVGIASAQPLDTPVRPSILVDFKAGGHRRDAGTVTLKSTSNRGIATLDVPFEVEIEGWFVDATFTRGIASGHITGQKCGDPQGDWIASGTYIALGIKGTQRWVITINPDGRTGSYTYEQKSQGKPPGSPVTIYVVGAADGEVTLTLESSGVAHMHLAEKHHTYLATTSKGGTGHAQPVPLEEGDLDWDPGGTC